MSPDGADATGDRDPASRVPDPWRFRSLLDVAGLGHDAEHFDVLDRGPGWRLERIVSRGQASADWYDQDTDEWVLVVSGAARLRMLDPTDATVDLGPGDALRLPARCRHQVTWTDPDQATVWLALHTDPAHHPAPGALGAPGTQIHPDPPASPPG